MGKFVPPIKNVSKEQLEAVYANVYLDLDRYLARKLLWRGMHELTVEKLHTQLTEGAVLDVGCGIGRFAFLASRLAAHVDAIDMTESVINTGRVVGQALGVENVEFFCSPVETFESSRPPYDVVYLGGVLEHFIDPMPILRKLTGLLARDGCLAISCPNESNFRGDVSTTLGSLFDFPMSLADIRQVKRPYVQDLCNQLGLRITKTLGTHYGRAWTNLGGADLETRIPNVFSDVEIETTGLSVNMDQFNDWIGERVEENQAFLDYLAGQDLLRALPVLAPFKFDKALLEKCDLSVALLIAYFASGNYEDPHYSEVSPFNLMGGQALYLLERQ